MAPSKPPQEPIVVLNWANVADQFPQLQPHERVVLDRLIQCIPEAASDFDDPLIVYPSLIAIAKAVGQSEQVIFMTLGHMEDKGVLNRQRILQRLHRDFKGPVDYAFDESDESASYGLGE